MFSTMRTVRVAVCRSQQPLRRSFSTNVPNCIAPFSNPTKSTMVCIRPSSTDCIPRRWTKAKRIILIRHGESMGNEDEQVYTNTPDWTISLTEKGKAQAADAGKQLSDLVGNEKLLVYVSPYARATQTLDCILENMEGANIVNVREDPRLAEQQFGNFQNKEEMRDSKEERNDFGRFFYRFPQGESGLDVYSRATSFFATLRRHCKHLTENCGDDFISDLNIVVVTHGLTLRLMLMRYFQLNVTEFEESFNPDNCQLVVMTRQVDDTTQWFELDDHSKKTLNLHNSGRGHVHWLMKTDIMSWDE
eukprot:m.89684 g.89684  ORF g.89684 m.89684 type:complete len:304 (-) comp26322_c0_seq1:114-1025(-)